MIYIKGDHETSYGAEGGSPGPLDGQEYLIMKEEDVLGILSS